MLRRKAYDRMLEWKRGSNGSTALLLEGARRVGKSTLVEEFGRREYRSCLIVDLFQAPAEVRQYFEDNRNDFDTLLEWLQYTGQIEEGLRNRRKEVPEWRIPSIPGSSRRGSSGRSCSSTTTA